MHDVKNKCNYKDFPLPGNTPLPRNSVFHSRTHWYINYQREKMYINYNHVVVLIFTFCQLSSLNTKLFKTKWKMVSIKFRKTFKRWGCQYQKFHKFKQFFNKNIFVTLKILWECQWNEFETDIPGMLLEYSGNITLWLQKFAKRSIFVIIKSYTFNTKSTFPLRTFYKIFFFKMSPKCSLDVLNIVTLREHSVNIPGISRASWVISLKKLYVPYLCILGLVMVITVLFNILSNNSKY